MINSEARQSFKWLELKEIKDKIEFPISKVELILNIVTGWRCDATSKMG